MQPSVALQYRLARLPDGWRVTAPGGVRMDFDLNGLATRFWNEAGQSLTFVRDDDGRLLRVDHSCGQSILFEYYPDTPRIQRASVPGQPLSVGYDYNNVYTVSSESDGVATQPPLIRVVRSTASGSETNRYGYEQTSRYMAYNTSSSGLTFRYAYTNVPHANPDYPERRVPAATWAEPGRFYEYTARHPDAETSIATEFRDGQTFDTVFVRNPITYQLLQVSHPNGETASYRYGETTRLPDGETLTNAAGDRAETHYGRDEGHRINSVQFAYNAPAASAPAWQIVYDPTNQLPTSVTDPCGRVAGTDYSAVALPLTNWVAVAPGQRLAETFAYNTGGLLSEYRDPCDRATSFTYGPGGYVTNVVPAAGPSATFSWNSALGILTNIALPGPDAPRIFALDKDELGRLRKITLPNGQYATFTRDVAGRVTNRTRRPHHAPGLASRGQTRRVRPGRRRPERRHPLRLRPADGIAPHPRSAQPRSGALRPRRHRPRHQRLGHREPSHGDPLRPGRPGLRH